jgi:hypothetical protein
MKRLHFGVALVMTITFSSLQAQTMNLRATIPFEFRLGDSQMPAGDYTIQHLDGKLIMRPQCCSKPAIILTFATNLPRESNTPGLLFHRYGETFFFDKVWTPGYNVARGVQETPLEKELARLGIPEQDLNIVLQTK